MGEEQYNDLKIASTIGLIWPHERKNGPLKEFIKIRPRVLLGGLRTYAAFASAVKVPSTFLHRRQRHFRIAKSD